MHRSQHSDDQKTKSIIGRVQIGFRICQLICAFRKRNCPKYRKSVDFSTGIQVFGSFAERAIQPKSNPQTQFPSTLRVASPTLNVLDYHLMIKRNITNGTESGF
jgi:hypothetical protein